MSKVLRTIPGGLVVIIDGLDGVGKTTQLQLAEATLRQAGWQVYCSRDGGGTPIGEALREVSLSQTPRPPESDLYISMAIHAALAKDLAQQRQLGSIILLDRGPLSNAGYQLFGGELLTNLGWGPVDDDVKLLNGDVLLVYQAPVKLALARARRKATGADDYFESKSEAYFERVAEGYAAAAKRYHAQLIDAGREVAVIQSDTMQLIQAAIATKLKT